jgi:DNA polymerase V
MNSLLKSSALIKYPISNIKAGFPSPASDFEEPPISLDQVLIKNETATFLLKVSGESMKDLGILNGDLVLVDTSIRVNNGDIVIAIIENEFTLKKFLKDKTGIYLMPANESYPVIPIQNSDDSIWGVVTSVIRKLR